MSRLVAKRAIFKPMGYLIFALEMVLQLHSRPIKNVIMWNSTT